MTCDGICVHLLWKSFIVKFPATLGLDIHLIHLPDGGGHAIITISAQLSAVLDSSVRLNVRARITCMKLTLMPSAVLFHESFSPMSGILS